MTRPKIMEDMKVVSHALDKSDVEIIERERGDMTASAYLRNLIRETQMGADEKDKVEKKLKKALRETKAKLKIFEQKETTQTKIRTETLTDMGVAYATYLKQTNPTEHYRNNWIDGRCKSAGVSPIEFLAFVEGGAIQK